VCKTLLRKDDYVTQTFEDLAVDKEVRIRKTLMKHYNKREEDFATLREYNDYLEEIEVMGTLPRWSSGASLTDCGRSL